MLTTMTMTVTTMMSEQVAPSASPVSAALGPIAVPILAAGPWGTLHLRAPDLYDLVAAHRALREPVLVQRHGSRPGSIAFGSVVHLDTDGAMLTAMITAASPGIHRMLQFKDYVATGAEIEQRVVAGSLTYARALRRIVVRLRALPEPPVKGRQLVAGPGAHSQTFMWWMP